MTVLFTSWGLVDDAEYFPSPPYPGLIFYAGVKDEAENFQIWWSTADGGDGRRDYRLVGAKPPWCLMEEI